MAREVPQEGMVGCAHVTTEIGGDRREGFRTNGSLGNVQRVARADFLSVGFVCV